MFSETCFSVQVVLPHPGNPMSMIISQSSRLPILQQQKQRHQSISQKTMVASIKKKPTSLALLRGVQINSGWTFF